MNPYNVDTHASNILGPVMALKVLYNTMPETTGCEKCSEVNGEDIHWCCRTSNPSMYYIEFLHVFKEFQKWPKSKRSALILRCIRNYLDNRLTKGCIFYDDGCSCYDYRPFMCRQYGVIPQVNWDKRWEELKNRQGDKFKGRSQCELVSLKDGGEITCDQEDKWFLHIKKTEQRLGIAGDVITMHDEPGGSYRTFHDHMMIELFEPSVLEMLSTVRMSDPSETDIDQMAELLRGKIDNDS